MKNDGSDVVLPRFDLYKICTNCELKSMNDNLREILTHV